MKPCSSETTVSTPRQDARSARAFIEALTGSADSEVTFQTFDDNNDRKLSSLARVLHGTLSAHWPELVRLNEAGAGVFVMVNAGDGKGRTEKNVQALRALFIDDDSGELEPAALELAPSIVVRSKKGLHAYWRLRPGESLKNFQVAQAALASKLGTDEKVKDLPHVMRVPGSLHRKDPEPFLVEVIQTSDVAYSVAEVLEGFGASLGKPPARNGFNASRPPSRTEDVERARRYLAKVEPAIEGEHGDDLTYRVAAVLVVDFNLSDDDALSLLQEWNRACSPPWSDADLQRFIAHGRRYGKHVPGEKSAPPGQPHRNGNANGSSPHFSWEAPLPFAEHNAPEFPAETLPEWLRSYVTELATSTQTPVDLPAMISLSALATALAKRARISLSDDWTEPLNLFSAVVLPPGSRKSAVFAAVTAPVEEFEQEEAMRSEPQRREALDAYDVAQARLKRAKEAAAKAKEDKRDRAIDDVKRLSNQLAAMKVPAPFRLLADDCTPEKLSTLLRDHDGRMALLSPEGGVFELMAGRYSDAPNLEVYLKGHAGDDLRVDRVNRPPEFVKRPALTIGLAIQPDVLQGLKDKPGFRGRGLLGRFLYALPRNTVGSRDVEPPPLSPMARAIHGREFRALLALPDGENIVRLSPEAKKEHRDFMRELEPRLGAAGDLAVITDWAAKLSGAVGRIAGLLHLAEIRTEEAFNQRVSAETMKRALSIGRYLVLHAQAAFAEMGADPDTEGGRRILAWLRRTAPSLFTKRDAHQALRGTFRRAEDLVGPLNALEDRGYIRALELPEKAGPGRRRSPTYEVHPLLSQYSEHSESRRKVHSEECEESVRVGPEARA